MTKMGDYSKQIETEGDVAHSLNRVLRHSVYWSMIYVRQNEIIQG